MATTWELLARALGDRVDVSLLPTLYERVSLPTNLVREELRAAGVPFQDVEAGQIFEPPELAEAAQRVVRTSTWRSVGLGALGGALGPLAVPPELLATLAHHLRLAQRLAVIYGFDPETDAGKLVVARALAAAYEVRLPTSARLELRVRDLPALVRGSGQSDVTGWLARQAVTRTAASLTRRVTRLVPGLGTGIAAVSAGRRTSKLAARMIEVYSRALEAVPFDYGDEELAVEVG